MRGVIRRLRWVMVGVILIDLALTYFGQPTTYWTDPATVDEGNRLFHLIMSQGFGIAMAIDAIYVAACFGLVSVLPRRLALTLLLALVFGHFFGGSTWLCFRFQLGLQGVVLYGVALAAVIVAVGFAPPGGPESGGGADGATSRVATGPPS